MTYGKKNKVILIRQNDKPTGRRTQHTQGREAAQTLRADRKSNTEKQHAVNR